MSSGAQELTAAELREEELSLRLGPWHIDIEITPTFDGRIPRLPSQPTSDASGIAFHNPREGFLRRLHRAFPNGLRGAGACWIVPATVAPTCSMRRRRAGRCLGFDLREHWIEQARFLAEHRRCPTADMRFEVCDLYDLPALQPGRFGVTLFLGIFYHLPDPITALKVCGSPT